MNEKNNGGQFFLAPLFGRSVLWITSVVLVYFATARLSLSPVFEPEGIAVLGPPKAFLSRPSC